MFVKITPAMRLFRFLKETLGPKETIRPIPKPPELVFEPVVDPTEGVVKRIKHVHHDLNKNIYLNSCYETIDEFSRELTIVLNTLTNRGRLQSTYIQPRTIQCSEWFMVGNTYPNPVDAYTWFKSRVLALHILLDEIEKELEENPNYTRMLSYRAAKYTLSNAESVLKELIRVRNP